ncbi:hypothetical protein BDZ97DRAFT_1669173, partial [Flammula alnicola]
REENVGLPKCVLERHKCPRDYTVFGPTGEKVVLEPEFHFPDYVKRFDEIMSGIEKSYINKKSMHVAHPSSSVIAVLTYQEYLDMPQDELHLLLAEKNVIVRGLQFLIMNSMRRVSILFIRFIALYLFKVGGSMTPVCEDTDLDELDREEKHIPATITGMLQEVLDEVDHDEGRIVNALDLPLCHESTAPTAYSTDTYAWHHTRGRLGFLSNEVFPTTDTCWALISSRHTVTFFHVDPDGFNTHMPLSSRHVFFDKGFRLDRFTDKAKYDLEAVFLSKGDFLLMRANQPHAVYGKELTIIHGGHFYLTSLMEMTAQSMFHSFIMDQFLMNTVHYRSRLLLRRIIDFYRLGLLEKKLVQTDAGHHLPDVQTFPGLVNLLSLCNLVILGNVLDFRAYSAPNQKAEDGADPHQQVLMDHYDRNNISKQERVSMMFARGIALELVRWVREFCVVTSPKGEVIPDLPSDYISRQMAALLKYKAEAEQNEIVGAPHCTLELLQKQINDVIACDEDLKRYWNNPPKKSTTRHWDLAHKRLIYFTGRRVPFSSRPMNSCCEMVLLCWTRNTCEEKYTALLRTRRWRRMIFLSPKMMPDLRNALVVRLQCEMLREKQIPCM